MSYKYKIGFVGYGNMAKAIYQGITKKLYSKNEILIYDPILSKKDLDDEINLANSMKEILANCEIVIFAVKPQVFINELSKKVSSTKAKLVITIMAGISSDYLKKCINNQQVEVIRVMPNTPAMVEQGMSVVQKYDNPSEYSKIALSIFSSIGSAIELDDSLFDAVTSVSGSGPAYVMFFMQSMISGAMDAGLSYDDARTLVTQTFKGSVMLVEKQKSKDIDELISAVCSPGGTTIEAIKSFEKNDLSLSIMRGMKACEDRSIELGKIY